VLTNKVRILLNATPRLTSMQYTIFFIAVQYWLKNPRHYEVTRDIGELLQSSEYADGIDLSGENEYDERDPTLLDDGHDSEDEPTESDLEFIDDSPVEDGILSSDEDEELEHG